VDETEGEERNALVLAALLGEFVADLSEDSYAVEDKLVVRRQLTVRV
jgi:hypothetical protein